MMKFSRIAIVTIALFVSISFAVPALAAMGKIDSFAFSAATNKDFAGAGSTIAADGIPDAEFTVGISGGTVIILAGFSLKNVKTGQEWSTSGAPNILVAVDNKGAALNSSLPGITVLLMADFRLYANDRAAITEAGGEYEVTAKFIDGSTATARTKIAATPATPVAPAPETPAAPAAPGASNAKIIDMSFKGRGNFDLSDGTKKLGSNLNPDYRFDVSIAGSDTLTGVRIRSTGGNAPEKNWDTVPTTSNPLVVVTEQGKGTPLNSADGSISIPIKDLRDLSFWIDGNDEVGRQDFRLTFLYTGARIDEADIKQAAAAPPAAQPDTGRRGQQRGVELRTKPTLSNLDVVGKDRKKAASGAKDYSMVIDVTGEGIITAIEVVNQDGVGKWDTIPRSKNWLTIVRAGNPPNQANNPSDFSLLLRIGRRGETLELLMEDDGTLGKNRGRLKITITWDDGKKTEELLTW